MSTNYSLILPYFHTDIKPKLMFSITDCGTLSDQYSYADMFSIDRTTVAKNSGGSGLGLYCISIRSESFGGKCGACPSSAGVGSTFWFSVPYVPVLRNVLLVPVRSEWRKVLVVEDSVLIAKSVKMVLEKSGLEVFVAYNGREALQALHERADVMLVLTDVQMPVMDGIELTLSLRKQEKEQQKHMKPKLIVGMSADTCPENVQNCRDAGMNAFLPKPFKAAEFTKILHDLDARVSMSMLEV